MVIVGASYIIIIHCIFTVLFTVFIYCIFILFLFGLILACIYIMLVHLGSPAFPPWSAPKPFELLGAIKKIKISTCVTYSYCSGPNLLSHKNFIFYSSISNSTELSISVTLVSCFTLILKTSLFFH